MPAVGDITGAPLTVMFSIDVSRQPRLAFLPAINEYIREDLAQRVLVSRMLGPEDWYTDEMGAARYNAFIRSPSYDVLARDVVHLEQSLPDLLHSLCQASGEESRGDRGINYVALGVGTGDKERLVLRFLLDLNRRSEGKAVVTYTPVDLSFPLLSQSLGAVFGDPRLQAELRGGGLQVKPMVADLRDSRPLNIGATPLTLISALGGIWNGDPLESLRFLRRYVLDAQDAGRKAFLLVDCNHVQPGSIERALRKYENPAGKAFFAQPLEALYRASRDRSTQVTFYDGKQGRLTTTTYSEFAKLGDWATQVRVGVVDRGNRHVFLRNLDFPARLVGSSLAGEPPLLNSKTIVIWYEPKSWNREGGSRRKWPRPVLLGYSTRFDPADYDRLILDSSFDRVMSRTSADGIENLSLLAPVAD
jgi:histidine-specific SAM-dependent methyltransferase